MSWLYEHSIVPSEKNGPIIVDRFLGNWSIHVGGFHETTTYLGDMWRSVFRKLPSSWKPKRILMLGLGAGGEVRTLKQRFRKAEITVVEWDEAMVGVAKKCKLFRWDKRVTVITSDAAEAVAKITDHYDLIVLDLFTGDITSSHYNEESFVESLAKRLNPDGYLVANFFRMPEFKKELQGHFATVKFWKYWTNYLGIFKHRGSGVMGDALPDGFLHHRQSQDYLTKSEHADAIIGVGSAIGSATRVGPFSFETFTTDHEPDIARTKHIRIINWQRIARTTRPKGWIPWGDAWGKQTGFFDRSTVTLENYWHTWSAHAKRHRAYWLKHPIYTIEQIPHAEFIQAYGQGTHLKVMKYGFLNVLKWISREHKEKMICWGARDNQGIIMAGLAVLDLPDISMSNHTMAFVRKEAGKTSVGTAVIDVWFRHCLEQGIRFMNFGGIWAKGDPRSWKGFSRFKRQFGIHVIRYPRQLVKIIWPQASS